MDALVMKEDGGAYDICAAIPSAADRRGRLWNGEEEYLGIRLIYLGFDLTVCHCAFEYQQICCNGFGKMLLIVAPH
jgi:hypothetical protein